MVFSYQDPFMRQRKRTELLVLIAGRSRHGASRNSQEEMGRIFVIQGRKKEGDLFKPRFNLELNQQKLKTQTKERTGIHSRKADV